MRFYIYAWHMRDYEQKLSEKRSYGEYTHKGKNQ